jgi:predicted anti-sigma-YlaC factor YlaD
VLLGLAHERRERRPVARRGRSHYLFVVHRGERYDVSGAGNQTPLRNDSFDMDCSKAREALSAYLDGEPADAPDAEISAHLNGCQACRDFVEHTRALGELTRTALRDAPAGPDLTSFVLDTARRERHRPDRWTSGLRLGLVAVAIMQLALAVPGLIFGTDEGAPIHIAHEVGAWDLALAIGFVFAAWRPLRAIGLLPFAAALSAGLVLTAVIDVMHGRAVALTETTHLLELVGTALLYLLVAPRPRARGVLRLA